MVAEVFFMRLYGLIKNPGFNGFINQWQKFIICPECFKVYHAFILQLRSGQILIPAPQFFCFR
jgi:hypothetical protein